MEGGILAARLRTIGAAGPACDIDRMGEVELKLQLPAGASTAVEREVAGEGAARLRLQAIYFDAANGHLAAAGLALRLRKEGRFWVQTLKAGSAHGLERAEHEVRLAAPRGGGVPRLDVARHAGTAAGEALVRMLGDDGAAALLARYRTDVTRLRRTLRTRRGRVELALDSGRIAAAQADGSERDWPLCELEVELVSGTPLAVIECARRLAARHALWPDTRSKAERGDRLARGLGPQSTVPAVKAAPLALARSMQPGEAWRAVLGNVLAQALPNWSELAAEGPDTAPEDAVHQLRVAVRGLGWAGLVFEGWPGVHAQVAAEPAAALFRALGAGRDRAVLAGGLQREIDAALARRGEPPLTLPDADVAADWSDATRARHGLLFIDLLGASLPPAIAPRPDDEPLVQRFAQRLDHWHRQARRDAKRFADLDDALRHRLRKRLKRLRYAIEFGAALLPERGVARYLERLRVAQEQLGRFNDVCVAEAAYAALLPGEPRAWFALGWLQARRVAVLADCIEALRGLRRAKPCWPAPEKRATADEA